MRAVVGLGAVVVFLFLAFQALFGGGSVSWNQRLTLVVGTPQGEVRGAAVTRVSFSPGNRIILRDLDSSSLTLRGEAALVEIAQGRWLFALLPDQERLIYNYVTDRRPAGQWPLGLEGSIPLILDQTEPLLLDPDAEIRASFAPRFPILVTFDDVAKPETVRKVDPADLDAVFGCVRTEGIDFPWREAGLIWRDWVERETMRLSREMAAGRAGLVGPAAAALEETFLLADDQRSDRKEDLRHEELRKLFSEEERRLWQRARLELIDELPTTLPSPEALSAPAGGQCHVLKAVTVQVSDEPVTKGAVEGLLPWLEPIGRERGTLIPNPPRLSAHLTNPVIQLLDPSAFSTELFK